MAENKMRSYKELQSTPIGEMTGAEHAFFTRVSQSAKGKKDPGFLGIFVKGTKGMVMSAADKFKTLAAETHVKDTMDRLKEIQEEKADLKKLLTDGDIKESQYRLEIAALDVEEEELKDT